MPAAVTTTIPSTFTLFDGKKIPVIGWGNGSGNARKTAVVSGEIALKSGVRHIDTAQVCAIRTLVNADVRAHVLMVVRVFPGM